MVKIAVRPHYIFIRAGLILLLVLLAIYIPLKVYISGSESAATTDLDGMTISIFVTNELWGYREPCS
ncbi:MAG: hypothetical protein JSV33_09895 [bacterium]|nr:MAG: hypothetical protein JSV33_09895 [bacterium]